MGISRQRVATLLGDAALKVAELNEERHGKERPVASPRAARLRELEDAPPQWVTNAIGTRPGRSKSSSGVVLAWQRAFWRSTTIGASAAITRPRMRSVRRRSSRTRVAFISMLNERSRRWRQSVTDGAGSAAAGDAGVRRGAGGARAAARPPRRVVAGTRSRTPGTRFASSAASRHLSRWIWAAAFERDSPDPGARTIPRARTRSLGASLKITR
jgi:hypothetical protein